MTRRGSRALFILVVAVAACGSPDGGTASEIPGTELPATTTGGDSPAGTAGTGSPVVDGGEQPMREVEAGRWLDDVAAGGSTLVLARVGDVTDDAVRFDVVAEIAGEAGEDRPGSYDAPPLWSGVERGDEALLVVSARFGLHSAVVYDPSSGEPRQVTEEGMFDPKAWLGLQSSIDRLAAPPPSPCGFDVEAPGYSSVRELFEAYLAGTTPSQRYEAYAEEHDAAWLEAEQIAAEAGWFVDAVTGWDVPGDDYAIYRSLVAGEDPGGLVVTPTVPVLLAVEGVDRVAAFALVEVETAGLLGNLPLSPGMRGTGGSGYLVANVGRPAPGHSVVVIAYQDGDLSGCVGHELAVARLLEVGTTVASLEYGELAGDRRLLIDVGADRIGGIDHDEIASLDVDG